GGPSVRPDAGVTPHPPFHRGADALLERPEHDLQPEVARGVVRGLGRVHHYDAAGAGAHDRGDVGAGIHDHADPGALQPVDEAAAPSAFRRSSPVPGGSPPMTGTRRPARLPTRSPSGGNSASSSSSRSGIPRSRNTTRPRRFSVTWNPASGTRPVIAAQM